MIMLRILEKQLNQNFANICGWFVGNKLSIHVADDKLNLSFLLENIRSERFPRLTFMSHIQ